MSDLNTSQPLPALAGSSWEYRMLHNVYGGFREGVRVFRIAPTIRTPAGGGHLPLVLAIPRSTNPQLKPTRSISTMKTTETSQLSILPPSPTLTLLSEGSLAKLSALLAAEPDLTTPEARSSLTSLGFSSTKDPDILYSKTSKAYLVMGGGQTIQVILGVLADLGYRVEWQVLNSKHFGVPQNRERIYIVGHLRGGCGRQILPIAGPDRTVTREAAIVTPHIRYGAGKRITSHTLENTVPTIRATHHKNGDNQPRVLEPAMLTETRTEEAKAIRRQHQAQGRDWSPRRGKVLKPRPDGIANTVTTGLTKEHLLLAGSRVRKLTPIETERLQGFPDNWTTGSDTQRYKQCGNAVTTKVVEAVISAMLVGCEL